MTTEDALPVVASMRKGSGPKNGGFLNLAFDTSPHENWDSLVRQSDALAALTLVQAERDAALREADAWSANFMAASAERDAMQQERDELRAALRELVALKDLRDEELRCRQRREVSIQRKPEEVARVNAMRDDYNSRKPIAWANARAILTPKATQQETRA